MSLPDVKAEQIRQLVVNAVTEEFDLDFKQSPYGNSDGDKRALRIDVAALANTAGGVIIIGVEEDDQARATAAPGVQLSDAEVGRMRQIIAPGVSPMPIVDILAIPDDADASSGFYVIAVPRSANGPHAVLVDNSLRYPKRNGATTRYLSEPEVAAAYRDRTAGVARQQSRIAEIELDAIKRLTLNGPWLLVTLVPDLPGDMLISSVTYSRFENEMRGKRVSQLGGGSQFMRSSVGRRRLLADGGGRTPLAEWCSLELHTDGAGVFGMRLWDMLERHRPEGEPVTNMVSDEAVVMGLVDGLTWLGRHAVERTAAGGNAVVRARLLLESGATSIEIGHTRFFGTADSRSTVGLSGLPDPAETVVELDDLTAPSTGMAAAVAALGNELGQAFGIPELGQFTTAGELNLARWSRESHATMRAWAEQHDIWLAPQQA